LAQLFELARVGPAPGAGDAVEQRVVAHVRPADLVGLGEAAPGDAVELAGLHRHLDVVPRHRDRDQPVARQEAAGGRHAEDALAVHVGQRADRLLGEDVQRVPGAGAQPFDALDLAIGFLPDLVQPVLAEQHRQVEAVAGGEREVAAEDRDVDRRGHGRLVRLHRVDRAVLQRAEQLARRHQLVGVVELDLHLAVRRLVEGLDLRQDHVRAQRRPGIGLQPPADRPALRVQIRRRQRGRGRRRASDTGLAQEVAPARLEAGSAPAASSVRSWWSLLGWAWARVALAPARAGYLPET
jgi:hypothetical protein